MDNQPQLQILSKGKKATAQSYNRGYDPAFALDGNAYTCWGGGPYHIWWQVDLEQACHVEKIHIVTGTQDPGYCRYYIDYSLDRFNWQEAAQKQDNAPARDAGEWYAVSIKARYLRVTMTYSSTGENVRIQHFAAYGRVEDNACQGMPAKTAGRKIPAVAYDAAVGVETTVVPGMEPGYDAQVLRCSTPGGYALYQNVDFTSQGVHQLRGHFGFCMDGREKKVVLEVRLDRLDGEKVGELTLFRQYTGWSELAGALSHGDGAPVTGVHDVYLVLARVDEGAGIMLHWISFARKAELPRLPVSPCEPCGVNGGEYQVYFGLLHCHTCFSDGIGVPEEAYDYARHVAGLSFLAITEHSNLFDEMFDWEKSRKWADIRRAAKEKTEDGAFLALYGAETTWYNQFGHMNTYHMDYYLNSYELAYNDIAKYYEALKRDPGSINQWNHPWSCGTRHLDLFEPYDARLDDVMHLIEVNPGESPQMQGLYYYVMALDKGWHIAPAGSQDNHLGQWGTENSLRTAVLVPRLTPACLYEAIRRQRVYFTCAPHLKVWFFANGAMMGARIPAAEKVVIDVRAANEAQDSEIALCQVLGERGEVLASRRASGHDFCCTISLAGGQRYYFLRVYQQNGAFAVTAPVWME